MSEQAKSVMDAASLGVAAGAVLEYLPAAAAAASLSWTLGRMISWAITRWRAR